MSIINFAHRGASGYRPENTMLAFEYAVQLGATGIETDVQLSADGIPVLIHDESLLRTTGVNRYVKDLSLAELKQLDAGSWYDPQYSHASIPTLEELLQLAATYGLVINIELKNGLIFYEQLEERVIALVEQYNLTDSVIISSFNHYSLKKFNTLAPHIQTGILFSDGLYEPWHYAKSIGATKLHAPIYATFPELVNAAKQFNVHYNVYTVNEENHMKGLITAGVAGIITDYPDKLSALLQAPNN